MKKTRNIIWGIALVVVGVLFVLKAVNIIDFSIFFDGWWTLFIIVPSVIGLFSERDKTGNIIGIIIGGSLLLACQDVIGFDMLWKLLIPAVIVIIGLKMIFAGLFGGKTAKAIQTIEQGNVGNFKEICATFSGQNINYKGQVFEGADLTAVFGGVDCDLRGAVIEKDCVIKVSAIFGGIDIFVDENVNVETNSTSIFGGMDNKTPKRSNVPTIYVTGTCLFGGVDVK